MRYNACGYVYLCVQLIEFMQPLVWNVLCTVCRSIGSGIMMYVVG